MLVSPDKETPVSITEQLLREFDFEFPATRKFLTLIPDDKLGWKPHEKSMQLGRLAWHLSDFASWATDVIVKDNLLFNAEELPKMAGLWKDKDRAAILARFDTDVKIARGCLATAREEAWEQRWTMGTGEENWVDEPRIDVYRKMVISHQAHHRAQLGVYYRLNGIPIPGVYGPSADES
jgi:DinB family